MTESYYSVGTYKNTGIDSIDGLSKDSYARIDYIFVTEEERGKGKGTELLHAAIAEAKSTGLPIYMVASELTKDTDLSRLVDWYEKEGFSVVDVVGDSVLMTY